MDALIISKSFLIKEALSSLFKDIIISKSVNSASVLEEIDENLLKYDIVFVEVNNENLKNICSLRSKNKDVRVVALDLEANESRFYKCVKDNIDGYITGLYDKEDFNFIIKHIISGKRFYDADLIRKLVKYKNYNNSYNLTKREEEVMNQVAKGLNNKEIADNLNITEFTVKKHISSIFNKLNLRNRQDIIIYVRDNIEQHVKY